MQGRTSLPPQAGVFAPFAGPDQIIEMLFGPLPRYGLIRTKDPCPNCARRFQETQKGFLCPSCRTHPRAYYILVPIGKGKKLYGTKRGEAISSWPLAVGTLSDIRRDYEAGRFDPREYRVRPSKDLLFETYGDALMRELKAEVRNPDDDDSDGRAPGGFRVLKSYYENHIRPHFSGKPIKLRPMDIREFLVRKRKDLKSDFTFKHVRSALRQVLQYAHENEVIPAMPPFPNVKKKWAKEKRAVRIPPMLTPAEQAIVVSEADEPHRILFDTATRTGMRPSETRCVREGNFRDDLNPPLLTGVSAKGLAARNIEIPVDLATRIRAHLNSTPQELRGKNSPLFLDEHERAYSERKLERLWYRYMDRAIAKGKVPTEKRCALKHGTRHAVVTNLRHENIPPEEISRYVGNSPAVIKRHYDHSEFVPLPGSPKGNGKAGLATSGARAVQS